MVGSDNATLQAAADAAEAFVRDIEPNASPHTVDLLAEVRTAIAAGRRVRMAAGRKDALAANAFLRVVLESAIRIRWVAGTGDFLVPVQIRARLDRQRCRDLMRMRDALTQAPPPIDARRAIEAVEAELAKLQGVKPAPGQLTDLAESADAKVFYGAHRLCSSIIHPGIGIRLVAGLESEHAVPMAASALDRLASIAAGCAGALDRDEPRAVEW